MQSFDELYTEIYNKNVKILDRKRRNTNRIIAMSILAFFLLSFISMDFSDEAADNPAGIYLTICVFIALVIIAIIHLLDNIKYADSDTDESYLQVYKEKVIEPIIKSVLPNCTYSPFKGISQEEYDSMGYDIKYTYFSSVDLIETDIDINTNNQIHLEVCSLFIGTNSKSEYDNDTPIPKFDGLIGHIHLNKFINSFVKITTSNKIDEIDKVRMDSSEFEKYFNVESDNKIAAMQILTSDVMMDIIDIWNKTNVKFEIIIKEDKIYLRFFTGMLFSTKIFGSSLVKSRLKKYYDILQFVFNISTKIYNAVDETEV